MIDIKEIYKNGTVELDHYRKGNLYYKLKVCVPSGASADERFYDGMSGYKTLQYMFPVPVSDCGDATFQKTDKASLFLRYIKQAIEDETLQTLATIEDTSYFR